MSHSLLRLAAGWFALALGVVVGFGPPGPGVTERVPSMPVTSVTSVPGDGVVAPVIPVLLVPGWGDEATSMEPLRTRFTNAGWPESRVSVLSFRDPVGSNAAHAEEIGRAVRVLRGLTGAPRVDIVAHSMGGLAVRQFFLTEEEAGYVRRVVFLGTPHRGTVVAVLSWGDGGREMVPGSPFLVRLNEAPAVPAGVQALAIRTPVDLRVIPASSAILRGEGVENVEICCPTHAGLVDDERTFSEVRGFLGADSGVMDPDGGGDSP
jgi:triacylglycerol esterase/lipase EstA (alpha/beta hydrolase family)